MALNLPLVLPIAGLAKNSDVKINLDFILAQFEALDGGTSTWTSVDTDTLVVNTIAYPSTNNAVDLGTDPLEWRSLYVHSILHNSASDPNLVLTVQGNNGSINLNAHGTGLINLNSSVVVSAAASLTVGGVANFTQATGQLRFGTSNLITLSVPAPASSITYTLPDVGAAADLLLTVGSQTITGNKTFASSALRLQEAGSTDVVTIAVASLGAGRTYTVPEAGGSADFVMTAGTQTIGGSKTFSSAVDITTISHTGGVDIEGTNTNDSASSGYVGEYVAGVQSTSTNFPTSGQFGNNVSITLTAGDWDISAIIYAIANGATVDRVFFGIGTASGNSFTGGLTGQNATECPPPNAVASTGGAVPPWRVSISGSTTYYLKVYSEYTVATPQYQGKISARRVR